mmetsp:Transcript_3593/g.7957  ORF Transcript_3593/g.7957 Transcript_3593/m.7957 type:complete len:232 (+) Transcript_3593:239-934(+)
MSSRSTTGASGWSLPRLHRAAAWRRWSESCCESMFCASQSYAAQNTAARCTSAARPSGTYDAIATLEYSAGIGAFFTSCRPAFCNAAERRKWSCAAATINSVASPSAARFGRNNQLIARATSPPKRTARSWTIPPAFGGMCRDTKTCPGAMRAACGRRNTDFDELLCNSMYKKPRCLAVDCCTHRKTLMFLFHPEPTPGCTLKSGSMTVSKMRATLSASVPTDLLGKYWLR